MDNEQKAIGAGGSIILPAGDTYDSTVKIAGVYPPEVFEMIILTPGTFTVLDSASGIDLLTDSYYEVATPMLGAYQANADVAKIPITFKEDDLLAKVTSGTAVAILYFVMK